MKDNLRTCIRLLRIRILKVVVFIMCVSALGPWVPNCRGETKKPADDNLPDFTKFSIEELMNVEIVSVSKKPEKLSEVAAAVFVITQEDIRRSGATSIPEALRMAPGVHVARITSTDWAINIRGLNDRFANNLLVLIDGRSVYTPVFSGVFWDVQDTVLEDIERIEVIRGPGATLWGVNAVNGVINIITKKAQKTQGWQVSALGGDEEGIGSVRYGGASEEKDTYYRIYGKYFNRGRLAGIVQENSDVQPTSDWQSGRVGFRADSEPGKAPATDPMNSFTLQGEAYKNEYKTNIDRVSLSPPFTILESDTSKASGAHLLGRWQHKISETSDTILQFYYDHAMKDFDPSSGRVDTIDFDFQHRFHMLDQHDIVWGLGYRFIADKFDNTFEINMDPARRNQDLFSAFAQDEIALTPDQLFLIVGSKFEHNDFTGGEVQPSIRMLWTPEEKYALWGAISRAVRIPSRLEHDVRTNEFVVNIDTFIVTLGNSNLAAEELIAYELGYRVQPTNTLWLNTTVFYNDYENLIGLKAGDPIEVNDPTPHFIIPLTYDNNLDGEAYGLEVAADWQVMRQWRLMASYSYLHTDIQGNDAGTDEFSQLFMRSNPRHQFSIRSLFDVTEQIDFDLWLRYVGKLPELNIDDYETIDARLAWRPVKNLELSVVGQNLFEEGHAEFSTLEVERSIYGKVVWSF